MFDKPTTDWIKSYKIDLKSIKKYDKIAVL